MNITLLKKQQIRFILAFWKLQSSKWSPCSNSMSNKPIDQEFLWTCGFRKVLLERGKKDKLCKGKNSKEANLPFWSFSWSYSVVNMNVSISIRDHSWNSSTSRNIAWYRSTSVNLGEFYNYSHNSDISSNGNSLYSNIITAQNTKYQASIVGSFIAGTVRRGVGSPPLFLIPPFWYPP